MIVRQESRKDFDSVRELIQLAFLTMPHSDGNEHNLVERLRNSKNFISELSLVFEDDNKIVGHILFTRTKIDNNIVLTLAPMSVLPQYQRKGVGRELIKKGLKIAKGLGYEVITVLGDYKYYSQYGFQKAIDYGIYSPVIEMQEYLYILGLNQNSLNEISGLLQYPLEFSKEV